MKQSLYKSKPSFYESLSPYLPHIFTFLIVFIPFLISVLLVCHEGVLHSVQGGI